MEIRFVDRSKQLTEANRERGERSLLFAVSRYGDEIQQITVYAEDVNGPRGGVDKRCVVRAKLRRGGSVEVRQDGTDFGQCLGLASSRLGRSVRRKLDVRRQFNRETVRRQEAFISPGMQQL
jgi:hypothetical protein